MLTAFEILGSLSATGLAYLGLQSYGYGVAYWRLGDPELKRSHRDAARIRRTWGRLARYLNLVLKDDMPSFARSLASNSQRAPEAKIRVPKIRDIRSDGYGMTIDFAPLPKVGSDEFAREAKHLANYWGMVRVSVEQPEPDTIRVRAVRRDPLERKLALARPTRVPRHLEYVPIGVDDLGQMVPLHLAHSTGVGVYGAPRWGKTSLILGVLTALAHRDDVQIILADGKSTTGFEGDYYDIGHRCAAVIGDDIEAYNRLIKEIVRYHRSVSWSGAPPTTTLSRAGGVGEAIEGGPVRAGRPQRFSGLYKLSGPVFGGI
ncbi:hypothetical protein [Nocardia gipuzkoensis]|uniref:hypothetical protein n=1 Tax=Nocardia gipuzkoensis TaxID=2749991 RepID=UPI0015EF6995|nr:hypothetical protein [Nocardia gipuzkoensis]